MSPRSAGHKPRSRQAGGPRRPVTNTELNPCLPSSALQGHHCLSYNFTWSAKPGKRISQLNLLMQQFTGSVRVWLSAGPIKWKMPSMTFWLVFQYPVT